MPTSGRRLSIKNPLVYLSAAAVLLLVAAVVVAVIVFAPKPHRLQMFDGGVPGTPEALAALQFAHDNHIDDVINYSALNAEPEARDAYLNAADELGVGVVVSLKDLIGDTDLDPVNAEFHNAYGRFAHPDIPPDQTPTTDQIVDGVLQVLDEAPAVTGWYISDELPQDPTGPEGLDKWAGPLEDRYNQVHAASDKPTLVSLYWAPDNGGSRTAFMKEVKQYTDQLMVDYYPYPDAADHVVRVGEIPHIGHALDESAGSGGTYVFQAFSWDAEPETRDNFGFDPGVPAPDADAMVDMASQALEAGAYNLAMFSYEYMQHTPGQEHQVELALARIHELPSFGGDPT